MDSVRELKTDAINPESLYVSCPYNPSHRILRARLQYHLVKCRRNVKTSLQEKPEEEKVICPLDATHHVNKEDLEDHMRECPNRKIVDSERYLIDSEVLEPASSYKLPEMPPCEENWDDPNEQAYTYDPTPHLENQPILRTMHGATKSERKAFRQVERMKMMQFHSGQPMNTAAAAAAAGVTIANGKFLGRGRGQNRLPLGRGVASEGKNKIDLNKIVGDGVGHTVPCPVEVGPLRPPRERSLALQLAKCSLNGYQDNEAHLPKSNHLPSLAMASNTKLLEKPRDAGIISGFGLNATENGHDTKYENNSSPQDWWDKGDSKENKGNVATVNLEEYKEKVKESKLAAKMGLSGGENPVDDERARDFTYLDEDWQIQGRRGRTMRGSPSLSASTGAISKKRNW